MRFRFNAKVSIFLAAFVLLSLTTAQAQLFSSKEFSSAKLYYTQKQFDKAKEFIEKALEKNSKSADVHYYHALILSELKDLKGQAFAAKTALELGGLKENEIKNCNALMLSAWANTFNAGVAAGNANDVDEAVKQYSLAAEILPDSAQAYYYMFVAQYNSKRYDDALVSIQKYIDKTHETQETVQFILNIYFTKARPFRSSADSLMSEFSSKKAAYAALKDKKKPPFNDFADSLEAIKVSSKSNIEYDKALAVLDKYQNSKYLPANWILEFKAQTYVEANRSNEALSVFIAAANASPQNEALQYNVGVLYLNKKELEKAAEYFGKAVELKPDYAEASYNLGVTYLRMGSEAKDKINEEYDKEVKKKKKDKKRIDQLSNDKSFLEYYKKALPYFEKVKDFRKNDPQFWTVLGQVYANLDMKEKAKEAFDNVK